MARRRRTRPWPRSRLGSLPELAPHPRPISPEALAGLIADLAQKLAQDLDKPGQPAVRVGIDSAIEQDGAALAAGVVQALIDRAVPAKPLHASDFLRPRSLRLEYGRDDDASYELWYDVAALRREALDHLGPGGDGSWLAQLRDPRTDRSIRAGREQAPAGAVVVLDGRYLLRPELSGALDLVAHLDVSRAARERRAPTDDAPLAAGAWELYVSQCRPAESADVAVRFDHPLRPAILHQR